MNKAVEAILDSTMNLMRYTKAFRDLSIVISGVNIEVHSKTFSDSNNDSFHIKRRCKLQIMNLPLSKTVHMQRHMPIIQIHILVHS